MEPRGGDLFAGGTAGQSQVRDELEELGRLDHLLLLLWELHL